MMYYSYQLYSILSLIYRCAVGTVLHYLMQLQLVVFFCYAVMVRQNICLLHLAFLCALMGYIVL